MWVIHAPIVEPSPTWTLASMHVLSQDTWSATSTFVRALAIVCNTVYSLGRDIERECWIRAVTPVGSSTQVDASQP